MIVTHIEILLLRHLFHQMTHQHGSGHVLETARQEWIKRAATGEP